MRNYINTNCTPNCSGGNYFYNNFPQNTSPGNCFTAPIGNIYEPYNIGGCPPPPYYPPYSRPCNNPCGFINPCNIALLYLICNNCNRYY